MKREAMCHDWLVRLAVAYEDDDAVALDELLKVSRESRGKRRSVFLTFPFLLNNRGIEVLERARKEGGLCAFGITLPRAAGNHRRIAFNGRVFSVDTVESPFPVGGAFVVDYRVDLASPWFVY